MSNPDHPSNIRQTIGDVLSGQTFYICSFDTLSTRELYEILRARADIFVGEEKILYPDPDGLDYNSIHVFCKDEEGLMTAYLRMFVEEDNPAAVKIGRVLTRVHGQGLGKKLLKVSIQAAEKYLGANEIRVDAQKHAEGFYANSGFARTSDEFMEAGVVHVKMRLRSDATQ